MPRHHTVGFPAEWINAEEHDGIHSPGYWKAPYQMDIPFTKVEESDRDSDEFAYEEARLNVDELATEMARLQVSLTDGTISHVDLVRLLQLKG